MLLPPAVLNAADRLAAIMMALIEAIGPIALNGSTPTFPDHVAKTLFFRLANLLVTLIRINNFGIRAPANPAAPKAPTEPAPAAQRSDPPERLPTHAGWLLEALPDLAPAIAAELAALLADPHVTALLAATPTLHRTLRPLLRALDLGLPQSPSTPPPQPDPLRRVGCPAPHHPTSPTPITDGHVPAQPGPRSTLPPQIARTAPAPSHAQFVTI